VRSRLSVVGVGAVLFLLSGCSDDSPAETPVPVGPVVAPPASAAGGACILLDYGLIENAIGVRFDIAAADQADSTSTCVVQSDGGSLPDLVLSVLEHTDADPKMFLDQRKADKVIALNGLGTAAYKLVAPAGQGSGPTVEVGWLTGDKQAKTLRFTFAAGAEANTDGMVEKLVKLAKDVDGS
jgi:hypothetical protein